MPIWVRSCSVMVRICSLPRSKERGLIEALRLEPLEAITQAFRVQKNAASLKLWSLQQPTFGAINLPRSKERGLIEAVPDVPECFEDDWSFRVQKNAASLKRTARTKPR